MVIFNNFIQVSILSKNNKHYQFGHEQWKTIKLINLMLHA